jgi:hypothetical protein
MGYIQCSRVSDLGDLFGRCWFREAGAYCGLTAGVQWNRFRISDRTNPKRLVFQVRRLARMLENPERPLNLEQAAFLRPPGVREDVPRCMADGCHLCLNVPCMGGQRELGSGWRLEQDGLRCWSADWGRSRGSHRRLGQYSWQRQTGKGCSSVLEPWHVRLATINFLAASAGYISISLNVMLIGWMTP